MGETSCYSAEGGLPVISASKQAGGAAHSATAACGGTSLNVSGSVVSGDVPFDAEVTVYSAVFASDPYNASSSSALFTPVVTLLADVNGEPHGVSNLTEPVTFSMPWSGYKPTATPWTGKPPMTCAFYNETTQSWSTEGVWLNSTDGSTITCATTHFTSFAAFQSSASTVAASLAALIAMLVVQLAVL